VRAAVRGASWRALARRSTGAETRRANECSAASREIIAKRKRNENAALVKYWRSYGVAGRHGRIDPKDFKIWIDWMVRSGELRAGQLALNEVFTNELNVPP
jgi:hypothetical protein